MYTHALRESTSVIGEEGEVGRGFGGEGHLTIILRNRAEYRLILSRRGRRPSRLKSDDIPQDWAG